MCWAACKRALSICCAPTGTAWLPLSRSEANDADDDLDDVVEVKRLSAKDGLEARDSPFAANNNFGGGFGVPSSPVPPALQRAGSQL